MGYLVGDIDGYFVGDIVGYFDGYLVGDFVGANVSSGIVGLRDGLSVGNCVGLLVGLTDGKNVGYFVGFLDGEIVGYFVGSSVSQHESNKLNIPLLTELDGKFIFFVENIGILNVAKFIS